MVSTELGKRNVRLKASGIRDILCEKRRVNIMRTPILDNVDAGNVGVGPIKIWWEGGKEGGKVGRKAGRWEGRREGVKVGSKVGRGSKVARESGKGRWGGGKESGEVGIG